MEAFKARGYEVVEREIWPDDLKRAQEVFLTGTAAEVTPVGRIDDLTFTPGEVCEALMDAYAVEVRRPAPKLAIAEAV